MSESRSTRTRGASRSPSSDHAAATGRAIQVLRTDRGWSRKELAERTGLSYSFLSEIENGVKEPSNRTFTVIAEALEVAPGALRSDAERRVTEASLEPPESGQRSAAPAQSSSDPVHQAPAPAAPPIQRSRRVLDWLAGPLSRTSSDDTPRASLQAEQSTIGKPPAPPTSRTEPDFVAELLTLVNELAPEDRELVLDLARRLALRSD